MIIIFFLSIPFLSFPFIYIHIDNFTREKISRKLTIIRIFCNLSDRRKLLLFSYMVTVFCLILYLNCIIKLVIFKNKHNYSFLLEIKYVEIDFDLFQEAITFKSTKSSLENCIVFYYLNIFKSYLSFLIITLLSFIRKVLIPFDFNSNKKIPTNLFLVGRKKMSYQCFEAGSATESFI
jgi:hypothetical protein